MTPDMIYFFQKEDGVMKVNLEEIRKNYMDNPPKGMTADDIRKMCDEDLLELYSFFNDDELVVDYGEEK